MLIMQRAVIQAISRWDSSQNISNPHSGGVQDPLSILNGRWGESKSPSAVTATDLSNMLLSGKKIAVHTWGMDAQTDTLQHFHVYTVAGVYTDAAGKPTVLLWNPWGSHIMVSWDAFQHDVMSVVIV